ncbi:MAG: tRNA (adenosine(37)-N6)-threonylcarbamoyltransferase complex dimerization subunit type 1 TsaB [Alphaproteobacteria bacterium]|nr:tRNA (adenosine(37)-N6)-threonylcarbamoyltransferase complex dimerization subunit type 1 TsaB [Alphaproteobacteria bacterium]
MNILAFDACMGTASVAVAVKGEIRVFLHEPRTAIQAEMLLPMIEQALTESGVTYDALDAVAVTVGPGSFTGVRIGLATAKGIALAAGKPLIGVTTLEAVALMRQQQGSAGEEIDAVLDARRGQVYFQRFDAMRTPLGDAALVPTEDMEGADMSVLPDARAVAEIAAEKLAAGAGREPVHPLYIRLPDAKLPQIREV